MELTLKKIFVYWWNGILKEKKIWLIGVISVFLSVLKFYLIAQSIQEAIAGNSIAGMYQLFVFFLMLFGSFYASLFSSVIAYGIIRYRDQFIPYYRRLKLRSLWDRFGPAMGTVFAFFIILIAWIGIIKLWMILGKVNINIVAGDIQIGNPTIARISGGLLLLYCIVYCYVFYGKSAAGLDAFLTFLSVFYDFRYLKLSLNTYYFTDVLVVFALIIVLLYILNMVYFGITLGMFVVKFPNATAWLKFIIFIQVVIRVFGALILSSLLIVGASFAHLSILQSEEKRQD